MAFTDVVILMAVRQVILWQFQDQRDQDEQLLYDIFCNLALKCLDFVAVLVNDLWMSAL